MPHSRPRGILSTLMKRAKLWPVIGVLGPRQSGKSVLMASVAARQRDPRKDLLVPYFFRAGDPRCSSYAFMLHGETVPLWDSVRLLARMVGWQS